MSIPSFRNQSGLSLVELMISMTLGLLILAGVTTVFVNNNRTRNEVEKFSRQIENGRYAMQMLTDDIGIAGYLGEYVPPTSAPTLAAVPDPCATAIADLANNMVLHVQGYHNASGGLTCIADVKAGTDVLVVRRVATCRAANPADANCDAPAAGNPYFQVSGCITDPAPAGQTTSPYYLLDTNTANLTLRKVGCTSGNASIRRYRTHIYFIANNDNAGDGIPTLKRAELGAGGFTIVPLVEGIENLQLQYGIDTNADGIPEAYTADPGSYNGCAGNACVVNWWNSTSIQVSLLARNETTSGGYNDVKTYTLAGTTYGPYNDSYRRHAYTATAMLANPVGRRQ